MKIKIALLLTIISIFLASCSNNDEYKQGYQEGYQAGFEAGRTSVLSSAPTAAPTVEPTVIPTEPRPKLPVNGKILIGPRFGSEGNSKITVHASSNHCVVKLKDQNGSTVLSFFVRANESVTLNVPPKILYAYFAEAREWYGMFDNFGEETHYSKDTQTLDFSNYTYEYTLYEVANGNLSLTEIDAESF